jgi:RNase H-fold protein (predicted Holliday junction resolvase)
VIIVWGGTRNVSKNESNKGLTEIRKFMENNKNTNIMIIHLPTRLDLEPMSCINQKAKVFNRKLDKYSKGFEHISVVGIKWDKEHHTKHGLHLNKKGKELLTNRLVMDIKDLFEKSQSTPIVMTGPVEENKAKLQMGKGTKRSRVSTSQTKGNRVTL